MCTKKCQKNEKFYEKKKKHTLNRHILYVSNLFSYNCYLNRYLIFNKCQTSIDIFFYRFFFSYVECYLKKKKKKRLMILV